MFHGYMLVYQRVAGRLIYKCCEITVKQLQMFLQSVTSCIYILVRNTTASYQIMCFAHVFAINYVYVSYVI